MTAEGSVACPRCSRPVERGATFCAACGAALPATLSRTATAAADGAEPSPSADGAAASSAGSSAAGVRSAASAEHGGSVRAGSRVGGEPVDPADVPPVGWRIVAVVVDVVLLAGVALLGRAVGGTVGLAVALGVALLGLWAAAATTGAVVGGRVTGIRVVGLATGSPPGWAAAFVRGLVLGAGLLVAGVGVLVVAASGSFDAGPLGRGWHDKAAGTAVLRARALPVGGRAPAGVRDASARADAVAPTVATVVVDGFAPPEPTGPTEPAPAGRRASAQPVGTAADEGFISDVPGFAARTPVDDLEHTRRAPVPQVAAHASRRALWLVTGTDDPVEVTGDGAVGRNPAAGLDRHVTHLVTLRDPSRSLSKLHLLFGPEGDGLWVVDPGSTNGTVLVDPDGHRTVLTPGTQAHVAVGWSLLLGDRTVRVEAR